MRPFFGYQRFSPYQVENLDLAYVLRTHVLRTQYQKIPEKKIAYRCKLKPPV